MFLILSYPIYSLDFKCAIIICESLNLVPLEYPDGIDKDLHFVCS